MEEKDKGELKETKDLMTFPSPTRLDRYYSIARFVFIILLVAAVGIFLINQALEYRYKSEFLQTPCKLCQDLNPNQSNCIDGCFKYRIEVAGNNLMNKEINYSNLFLPITSP
jgi:hypothetical protein